MNALASFFLRSKLLEDAYQGLMGAFNGSESLRSSRDPQEDAGYHNAFFASQTWSFVQTEQTSEPSQR